MIYLDHAASTPMLEVALNATVDSLQKDFANSSASHRLGRSLYDRVHKYREIFLKEFGDSGELGKSAQFYFVSSATEANNHLIKMLKVPYTEIWYHTGDHPSMVMSAEWISLKKSLSSFSNSNRSMGKY